MPTTYSCERVDADFVESAPFVFSNSVSIPATPRVLFGILEEADAWPKWARVITRVEWTSPPPHGVGTTRTVHMLGGLVGEEEFLAWEPERHIAFRFNACSTKAIKAFVETYDIAPTNDGCRLTWTLAMKGTAPTTLSIAVARPVMNFMFRRYLRNLSSLAAER